ncbi:MAG: TIGR02281 family clan AA aspartic protease [Candidatus Polarisedimenticolaceae bacterium]|nr:TIGR02281 family clan AA aspartic protease [Candidatus Polarisedimenticolaceae bacterium]
MEVFARWGHLATCRGMLVTLLLAAILSGSGQAMAIERLRVVALFSDKAMVEINGKNRLLKKGKISPEGVLLISADARGVVLEINGKRESYELGRHVSASYSKPKVQEVRIWRNTQGSYTTVGTINGRTVNMLVDTGASSVAMSEVEARRLAIPYRLTGKVVRVSTASSGNVKGYRVLLDRVQVGDILLRNVRGTVIEGSSPREVLLGMTFLGQLQMENSGSMLLLKTRY